MLYKIRTDEDFIARQLLDCKERLPFDADGVTYRQMSLFDDKRFYLDEEQLIRKVI